MSAKSGWDDLEKVFETASADQLCESLIDRMMNVIPAKQWKSHEEFTVEMLFLTKEFVTFARRFSSIEPEHKVAISDLEGELRQLVEGVDRKAAKPKREADLVKRFQQEAEELSEVVEQARYSQLSPEAQRITEQFEREVPNWRNLRGKKLDRAWDDFVRSRTSEGGKWWWDGSEWQPNE